jgi:hypothetical protein
VSFLKFVEWNWNLPTVSPVGRDNLPNPIARPSNPYAPINSPAIADLTDMFNFHGDARQASVHVLTAAALGTESGSKFFPARPSRMRTS